MNRTMHNWKAVVGAALLGLALSAPASALSPGPTGQQGTQGVPGGGGYGTSTGGAPLKGMDRGSGMDRGQTGAGYVGDSTTTGNPCASLTGTDRENCMRDARNWHQGGSRDANNPSTTTPGSAGQSARCTQMMGSEREACERAYR